MLTTVIDGFIHWYPTAILQYCYHGVIAQNRDCHDANRVVTCGTCEYDNDNLRRFQWRES